jgi:hypothetical protein
MARVTIDSGPPDAADRLRDVPRDKWFELMQARRGFLRINLPYDCRQLLGFVEDAEKMYSLLGFTSANDFIKKGLELDPKQVSWAIEGLRRMQPNKPIPFKRAIELGKRGRPKKGEEKGAGGTLKRGTNSRSYILARLARDGYTDLAGQVRNNEISAKAAAEQVGYRKRMTALEKIKKLWDKLDQNERKAYLEWILQQEPQPSITRERAAS